MIDGRCAVRICLRDPVEAHRGHRVPTPPGRRADPTRFRHSPSRLYSRSTSSGIASSCSVITRSRYSRKCSGSTSSASRERLNDVVRRHRPVPVHEVVEVAGREARLRREPAVGDPRLVHQPLDRRAERLRAEPPSSRHSGPPCPSRQRLTVAPRRSRDPADVDLAVLERLLPDGDRGSGSRSGRRRRTSRRRAASRSSSSTS